MSNAYAAALYVRTDEELASARALIRAHVETLTVVELRALVTRMRVSYCSRENRAGLVNAVVHAVERRTVTCIFPISRSRMDDEARNAWGR